MPAVELNDDEWQKVLNMIACAPWKDANPLLLRIGDQLRAQQTEIAKPDLRQDTNARPHNPAAH